MSNKISISKNVIETEQNILSYFSAENIKSDTLCDFYDTTIGFNLSEFVPIICIKKINAIDEISIKKYLKIYWNKNNIPISIFIFPNEVRIYNNFQNDIKKSLLFTSSSKEENKLTLDEICSNIIFTNEFWDDKKVLFPNDTRVDEKLLSNILQTILILSKKFNILPKMSCNFMAKCIFIQYMEDRKMLTPSAFSLYGADTFVQLLSSKNLNNITAFFDFLKKRFSGDIFSIDCDILKINISCLDTIADFFSGMDMRTSQLSFLGYDFSCIPIELISSIYEKLFEIKVNQENNQIERKKNGVYYTPYYLADFSISKAFEYIEADFTDKNFRGCDPACGSGVFLVSLFKRIVEAHRKNGTNIDSNLLRQIITNQLFGIDKNSETLSISAFSLYIALMDYLNPKDINENSFVFPLLVGNSLICNDSFNKEIDEKFIDFKFDLVVGNPPWVSVDGEHVSYCKRNHIPLSDKQIAQSFIARAIDFMKPTGIIALIVTNSIFYSTNAQKFRKYLIDTFDIKEIIDLSDLKVDLFASAAYPCSILIYGNKINTTDFSIKHYFVKKSLFTDCLKKLVVEAAGYKQVNYEEFNNDIIWRFLKNGSPLDYRLILNLQNNDKLKDLMKFGISLSEGAVIGNNKNWIYVPEYKHLPLLTSPPRTSFILKYNIVQESFQGNEYEYFERPRKIDIFKSKYKVLLKRCPKISGNNLINAAFYEGDLLFFNTYIAFHSNSDPNLMLYIEALLNSKFYTYYQFYMSDWFRLSPPEIRKDRIENFVVPDFESSAELRNELIEKVKDIHNYISTQKGFMLPEAINQNVNEMQKQCDSIIFSMYKFTEEEIQSINYTCDYVIPAINTNKNVLASRENLDEYILEFKKELANYIGENDLDIIIVRTTFAYCLFVSKTHENSLPSSSTIDSLVKSCIEKISDRIAIAKKVKYFTEDLFLLAKTKELYNWTVVNARLDVNEFITDSFNLEDV